MSRTELRKRTAVGSFYSNQDHFSQHERAMNRSRLMFRVMSVFVALIFVATASFLVYFFVSGQSVSYSVDYKIGDVSYEESYEYGR